MGVTIFFKGTLKNTNLIDSFIDEMTDIAQTMKWEYQILDDDWSQPATATLSFDEGRGEITSDLGLKGISISLHPGCESLPLYFNADGALRTPMSVIMINDGTMKPETASNFVKTQFAPPAVHISIVKLLKYINKVYVPDLTVMDESDYWETEDRDTLIQRTGFLNKKLDQIGDTLNSIDNQEIKNCSPEQLAEILERRLKQFLK
ncbi:hypothetical protein JW960_10180 [candidate division KSB1 bacterium]|nr:hypothetical protein [candidate division KSB1 bacterium]